MNNHASKAGDRATQELNQALTQLYARQRFGMRQGLDRMTALMDALDRPQQHLAAIHIAGTNGKGSVAAMLACILQAAGIPAGCYTSPHLVRFNERFVCGGAPISDEELLPCLRQVEAAAKRVEADSGEAPTFFECATAIALLLFRQHGLPLAIVETGLGGRLDATNILLPALSVVTRIGMDHMQWLGDTLEAIATEKAGIVKPGRPVVRGAMPPAAAAVIEATAARLGSPCVAADTTACVETLKQDWTGQTLRITTPMRDLGRLRLSLNGAYQAENAATCVTACDVLQEQLGIVISDDAIREGLAHTVWPGRFHCVQQQPPVIVDGAHNSDAARALRSALHRLAPRHAMGFIIGMCADKAIEQVLRELAPLAARAWTVPTPSPRSANPEMLAASLQHLGVQTQATTFEHAATAAEDWASDEPLRLIVICGSLFLAGQALSRYHALSGAPDPNEALQVPAREPPRAHSGALDASPAADPPATGVNRPNKTNPAAEP